MGNSSFLIVTAFRQGALRDGYPVMFTEIGTYSGLRGISAWFELRRSNNLSIGLHFGVMKNVVVITCFCYNELNIESKKHRFFCLIYFHVPWLYILKPIKTLKSIWFFNASVHILVYTVK